MQWLFTAFIEIVACKVVNNHFTTGLDAYCRTEANILCFWDLNQPIMGLWRSSWTAHCWLLCCRFFWVHTVSGINKLYYRSQPRWRQPCVSWWQHYTWHIGAIHCFPLKMQNDWLVHFGTLQIKPDSGVCTEVSRSMKLLYCLLSTSEHVEDRQEFGSRTHWFSCTRVQYTFNVANDNVFISRYHDNWVVCIQVNPVYDTGSMLVPAGYHSFRVEYWEITQNAWFDLKWKQNNNVATPIPASNLFLVHPGLPSSIRVTVNGILSIPNCPAISTYTVPLPVSYDEPLSWTTSQGQCSFFYTSAATPTVTSLSPTQVSSSQHMFSLNFIIAMIIIPIFFQTNINIFFQTNINSKASRYCKGSETFRAL